MLQDSYYLLVSSSLSRLADGISSTTGVPQDMVQIEVAEWLHPDSLTATLAIGDHLRAITTGAFLPAETISTLATPGFPVAARSFPCKPAILVKS